MTTAELTRRGARIGIGSILGVLGEEDLSEGVCAHRDPDIWSGEWLSRAGQGEQSTQIRDRGRARAVALCRACPVLDACERQLAEFERVGRPVFGIIAGRMYTRGISDAARRRRKSEGVPCRDCGRVMHIKPRSSEGSVTLPEGHTWSLARGRCQACYSAWAREQKPRKSRSKWQ